MSTDRRKLVSVITVTYNSAAYVRDTIESVLAQTYTHIEYIIGDDRSTANTWAIIGEYKDVRIKAYRNDRNLREYPNRTKAMEMASGEYLIFIDGDDIILPHGLDFLVTMLETFPQAGMAIQKNYYNNILYPALFEPIDTLRNYFYGSRNLLNSSFSSNFFRTSIIKDLGLNSGLISGDQEVRLRIAARYPVLFVAGWVTWPRETPGQASSRLRIEVEREEAFHCAKEILDSNQSWLDPSFVEDVGCLMKQGAAKFVLLLIRKGKLKAAWNFPQKIGVGPGELVRYYFFKPRFADVLTEYSAVKPFRRGFLNKV
jgi:glycosyltransferase involved in cell wall biosynthesis